MTIEKTKQNAVLIPLADYIAVKNFRVINSEDRHIKGGISEIPVLISVKDDFVQKCRHYLPKSGDVCGFVKMTPSFKEENKDRQIKQIELYDWKDKFGMFFIYKDGRKKKEFLIDAKEVMNLLENALYPN